MQFVHGIKIICTAHGEDFEKVKLNNKLKDMIEQNFFEKLIFLKSEGIKGEVERIIKINN